MEIAVSIEDAKQLMELYKTCVLADRHFHSCQSDLYRRHVSAACKSRNVSKAFERLKEQIDCSEKTNSLRLEE